MQRQLGVRQGLGQGLGRMTSEHRVCGVRSVRSDMGARMIIND
jgi:hypothetical protein